jgi:dipeptidyl aminopeptidase/acylaminoacyl peptidase
MNTIVRGLGFGRFCTLFALSAGALLAAQSARAQLPTLTPRDYGRWERLGAFELDPEGRWLVAAITRMDDTSELQLRRSDGSRDALVMEFGSGPAFGADGRFMAYRKGVHPEVRAEAGRPVPDRLGLVELEAERDTVLFDVTDFAFRDDGRWLAAHAVAPSDSVGGDLVVMDPGSGAQTVIGNVSSFAWQDGGPLLAVTLRTAWGTSNGVALFDPDEGRLRTLESGDADYVALSWRDESAELAVLRSVETDDRREASHDVLVWEDVRVGGPAVLSALDHPSLGRDVRVTPYAGVSFSRDGSTLFVGVRPWEPGPVAEAERGSDERGASLTEGGENPEDSDDAEPADVQVWHWNDDQVLRAQEYAAARIARQTLLAAWHPEDGRLIVLGEDLEEPVTVVAGGAWGIVPDYDPYVFERRFGSRAADWYRVDVATGARARIGEHLDFGVSSHADLDAVMVYDADRWSFVDLPTLQTTVVGEGRSFTQPLADYDYPGPRPAWGFGAWLDDGSAALLYDRNDVWRADARTGALTLLTDGADKGWEYRLIDPEADGGFRSGVEPLRAGDPVWYAVRNLGTKASGYAQGSSGGGVELLLMEDARTSGLTRAHDTDRYAFRSERWDDSPDVFVSGARLRDARQVTETNAFQSDFAWGRSELLDYTTAAGHELQAILVYPAAFEEGRRYPLILYQYERLSDGLHAYDPPSERDYYNYQVWSQNGYFVLMPDIVYEPGRPGPSALDAVENALDAAVATGHVDPERMGLIGHSWGGYQAAYLPTRTNRFAASVAGAAITNFLSFMGAVHWNGGLPETGHWETGQARMAAPYWDDLAGHLESSPANFIEDLQTPMLLMHGDADGVVDFYQGLEFYNYARRAGKEVVLLVYPDADHGLTDKTQQVDYHRRILQWFGHWLKGEPAAPWITRGESWVERERRRSG